MVRESVCLILRNKGLDVIEAADGASGIELARSHRPQLILSDIFMSGLDGFDVLDTLKGLPSTCLIPFVFMTGSPDRVDSQRHPEIPCLQKPFALRDLLAIIAGSI